MFNLLKSEFFKLRKSKEFKYLFWSMCILSLVKMINMIYSMEVFLKNMGTEYEIRGENCFFDLFFHPMPIVLLCFIFGIIFVCYDFENRFIHSVALAGYNKLKIILCKFIVFCCAIVTFILSYVLICTIGISIIYGFGEVITFSLLGTMMKVFLLNVLIIVTIASFAVMAAYIFRVISVTSVICLVFMSLYLFGLTIIQDVFKNIGGLKVIVNNSLFELFNKVNFDMESSDVSLIIGICSIYMVAYFLVTYIALRKAELN